MKKKEREQQIAAPPWWQSRPTGGSYPTIPAPKCRSCGSVAGARDGCCVVCSCPTPDRQVHMAPMRQFAFAGGGNNG